MEELKIVLDEGKSPVVIKLNEFKGRKLLDIRKHFTSEDELKPTKKGISLNAKQLSQVVNSVNANSQLISDHFESSIEDITIDIEQKHTLGRGFNFEFENEEKKLIISPNIVSKLGNISVDDLSKLLMIFHMSITDVIDDESDIDFILDRFDSHLKRMKW